MEKFNCRKFMSLTHQQVQYNVGDDNIEREEEHSRSCCISTVSLPKTVSLFVCTKRFPYLLKMKEKDCKFVSGCNTPSNNYTTKFLSHKGELLKIHFRQSYVIYKTCVSKHFVSAGVKHIL